MNNNNGKVVLALLAGVATGAAVGMLAAPAKGTETRKQLSDSAKRMAGTLREKVQTGLGALAALTEGEADNAGGMRSPAPVEGSVKQHV